jgi:uroporphyrinogen-III synthase
VKLLIIRPQPGADATAQRARNAGFEPIVMPLFAIERLPWQNVSPADFDAVLLTSGNAVRAAGEGLEQIRDLPVYAVGTATARALEQASLHSAFIGTGGVDELIAAAIDHGLTKLLWLAGEEHSAPLPKPEIELDIRIVYRSAALAPAADFREALRQADVVMLHSARAAKHFAALCDEAAVSRQDICIAAFSQIIANSAGEGWASAVVAPQPNDTALLSEVQRHFTTVTRDP